MKQRVDSRPGELLIRFREDAPVEQVETLIESTKIEQRGYLRGESQVKRIRVPAGQSVELLVSELRSNPLVDIVEPNYIITADQHAAPDDPLFAEQWSLRNQHDSGGRRGADIGATRAWSITTGTRRTVVAIIDSGIDFTHADLHNNRWLNLSEQANGRDDDGNGLIDDLDGWDWTVKTADDNPSEHGTGVAGIIAGEGNNGTGIAGVMWQASLMDLRVLDPTGTGDVASAVEAIDYAIAHRAHVINISWGTNGASSALREAIVRAARRGVIVVCSAGNGGHDTDNEPRYPASFNLPNVISVAATDDSANRLTKTSNWGKSVDLAAPGSNILTTRAGGGYGAFSGTSAAAAFVSGAVGLIKTQRPRLRAERVRELVLAGVRPVAELTGRVSSGGVLDASAILERLGALSADSGFDIEEADDATETVADKNNAGAGTIGTLTPNIGRVSPPAIPGRPHRRFPNLDAARQRRASSPRAIPPVPSTSRRCPPRNPHCNRDGVNPRPSSTPISIRTSHAATENSGDELSRLANPSLSRLLLSIGDAVQPAFETGVALLEYAGLRDASDSSVSLFPSSSPASMAVQSPANRIYLSDLGWISATNNYHQTRNDLNSSGAAIKLHGVSYSKGVGTHAPSEIRYHLDGNFSRFVSDIGIDDSSRFPAPNVGTVIFEVWLDGAKVYDSGAINGGTPIRTVYLDVAGKQELKLVVTEGGNGPSYDHADWAGARLLRAGVDPALVAHWNFEEGTGTSASDATGNNNAGIVHGALWSAGKVGASALDFNGVTDRMSVASSINNTSITDITNNFTLSFWARPEAQHEIDTESTSGYAGVTGQRYVWGAPGYGEPGRSGALVSVGTNGVSVYEHAGNYMPALLVHPATLNGWTHITLVYENNQPKLYVNGALARTGLTSPKSFVHIEPADIGGMIYGYFDGALDEVHLYDGALSQQEIAELAKTDLVAHWKFDEASGTAAANAVGGGNNGSLQGPTWVTGRVNSALSFDGVDDRVMVSGTSALTDVTNNFTISFWANPQDSHQIDAESASGAGGVSGQKYAIGPGWNTNGHAGAGISVGTNGISVYEHADGYMPATLVYQAPITGWTHISVVYENRQPRLYVNGTLVRTGLTSTKPFIHLTPSDIGGMGYGYFKGFLDELRLSNTALSQAEIAAQMRLASNELYLSDLDWTAVTHNYRATERDKSVTNPGPIVLDGIGYGKGLGSHAPSDIRYYLGGNYSTLISDIGVNDEITHSASIVFQVWADGTKLFDSGLMTASTPKQTVNVNVAGKNELRLVVTEGGNGPSYDHIVWAGAKLIRSVRQMQPTATGLKGLYFDDTIFSDYRTTRTDATVNFDWGLGAPVSSMAPDTFSVQWTGQVVPRYSETYTFYTISDDGIRLWVDHQLLIDNWAPHTATENSGTIALNAGEQYDIRLEYYEQSSGAVAKLLWSSLHQSKEVIPQSQLYGCWKSVEGFVRDFYLGALARQPDAVETQTWTGRLLEAHGGAQLLSEVQSLGRTLFKSTEYANRNRTAHDYAGDLYRSYLQRDPNSDPVGWGYWASIAATNRDNALNGFAQAGEFAEKTAKLCGTSVSSGYEFSVARVDPINRTGQPGTDPLSRNYSWSAPLLSLPGRSGLDLDLSISLNSLVWTRTGSAITFDADHGSVSPGFRVGFPVVQRRYYNPEIGRYAFLWISPSGERVELQQKVDAPDIYEANDSSYLQLIDSGGGSLLVRTPDGTRLSFLLIGSEYQCTEVKDRNGNFISINFDSEGQITTIVDTLGRTVRFRYDGFQNLIQIDQIWTVNGQPQTHVYATFGWGEPVTIQTKFPNLTVIGPANGEAIPLLRQVGLDDGTYYKFDYTSWGQVRKITHYAADSNPQSDNHPLSYFSYDLPTNNTTPHTDCPRFTERREWVENWNGDEDGAPSPAEEAVTSYHPDPSGTNAWCMVVMPDRTTVFKEYYGTGRQRGRTTQSEVYSLASAVPPLTAPQLPSTPKKKTVVTWTQDNTTVEYPDNPRVTDIRIYDDQGNQRRTSIDYLPPETSSFRLPQNTSEYDADASTVLRRTHTKYNLDAVYLERRIIGLIKGRYLYGRNPANGAETLLTKVTYQYDEPAAELLRDQGEPIQHDAAYGIGFRQGRGNLTSVQRWDVNAPDAANNSALSFVGYNTAGSVVMSKNALGHQTIIDYADRFTGGTSPGSTLAYPTAVTDPDQAVAASPKLSLTWYDYDRGLVTKTRTVKGVEQTFAYDSANRIKEVLIPFNGARTSWDYASDGSYVHTYSTLVEGQGEMHSFEVKDGIGRTIAAASDYPDNPANTPRYRAQDMVYDVMHRLWKQSNPTEVNVDFVPTGDDAAGWVYKTQTFDWMGRPLVSTYDGASQEVTYEGCGCAGGEVVTVKGEAVEGGRRQQRFYHDALGRLRKTELYNWNGVDVYSTTVNSYNARDQFTSVKMYQGAEPSNGQGGVYREVTMSYDGHARLASRQSPEQNAPTTYTYFANDSLEKTTDARNAAISFGYNRRGMVESIVYSAPSPIPVPAPVSFQYDEAGNRTSMTDETGSVVYQYSALSQLVSEQRQFTGASGTFALNYQYAVGGALKKITDNFGAGIEYKYNHASQMQEVNGTGTLYANVAQYARSMKYRAWGALKSLTYGNNLWLSMSYDRRLQVSQFEVGGRNPQYGPSTVMLSAYQRQGDGSVRFADDGLDDRFDRAYRYDQAARLSWALTGGEARHVVDPSTSGQADGPYWQSYQLDAWNNMTGRSTRYWSEIDNYSVTFDARNRIDTAGYEYDAAGNITKDPDMRFTFDAAGRNRETRSLDNTHITSQWHDGDGQVSKRTINSSSTTFYLRSSVLGGRVVAELNPAGQKQKGYVYAGDTLLAVQEAGDVTWQHSNPVTNSRGESGVQGGFGIAEETDSMGVNVGTHDPYVTFENGEPQPEPEPRAANLIPNDPGGRCRLDGFAFSCAGLGRLLSIGAAAHAPVETFTTLRFRNRQTGEVRYALGTLVRTEYQIGYVPIGADLHNGEYTVDLGDGARGVGWLSNNASPSSPNNFNRPQNTAPTQRLSETDCNNKLAALFGGPGAVVSTVNEPSGINPAFAGDNRSHHLANNGVLHIYGNAQGTTTDAALYRPPNGTFQSRGSGEYEEKIEGVGTGNYSNVFQFKYSGGLVIKFFHVGGTSGGEAGGARLGRYPGQTNAAGSSRIGNIGGLGGTGDRYNHSHLEFRVNGRRTDPRKIYCGY